jgi:hypothetical protein
MLLLIHKLFYGVRTILWNTPWWKKLVEKPAETKSIRTPIVLKKLSFFFKRGHIAIAFRASLSVLNIALKAHFFV